MNKVEVPSLVPDDVLAEAVRASRAPMIVTDPTIDDNPIVFANAAFLDMTGYARSEVTGRNCRFLQGPDTDPAALATLREALGRRDGVAVDLLNYRKNGEPFWNAVDITPLRDEGGAVRFFFGVQADLTGRHGPRRGPAAGTPDGRRAAELEKALEIQQLLVRENDHRVKNSLQMVSAMLMLQAMSLPDARVQQTLREMLERVEALGLAHKRIYELAQWTRFDLSDFLRELAGNVVGASGRKNIAVDLRLEPVTIPAGQAAPVALILNELLTNAVKHGFRDGRAGRIAVSLALADGRCTVTVSDDGVGLDAGSPAAPSFGTTLIETLVQQVDATLAWRDAGPGTAVTISFPA